MGRPPPTATSAATTSRFPGKTPKSPRPFARRRRPRPRARPNRVSSRLEPVPIVPGDVGAHGDEGEAEDHEQARPGLKFVESGREQMSHVRSSDYYKLSITISAKK